MGRSKGDRELAASRRATALGLYCQSVPQKQIAASLGARTSWQVAGGPAWLCDCLPLGLLDCDRVQLLLGALAVIFHVLKLSHNLRAA